MCGASHRGFKSHLSASVRAAQKGWAGCRGGVPAGRSGAHGSQSWEPIFREAHHGSQVGSQPVQGPGRRLTVWLRLLPDTPRTRSRYLGDTGSGTCTTLGPIGSSASPSLVTSFAVVSDAHRVQRRPVVLVELGLVGSATGRCSRCQTEPWWPMTMLVGPSWRRPASPTSQCRLWRVLGPVPNPHKQLVSPGRPVQSGHLPGLRGRAARLVAAGPAAC